MWKIAGVVAMMFMVGCDGRALTNEGDGMTVGNGNSTCGAASQPCCNVDAGLQQCMEGLFCDVTDADTVNMRETCR